MVKPPKKLETGLRTTSAWISCALLLRIEAIGFPTFGFLPYGVLGFFELGSRCMTGVRTFLATPAKITNRDLLPTPQRLCVKQLLSRFPRIMWGKTVDCAVLCIFQDFSFFDWP